MTFRGNRRFWLDEIFGEDLLFVLPFYIFPHEARFPEYEADASKLRLLQEELATIVRRVNERVEQGKLLKYEATLLIEMTSKVAESLAAKYRNVKEGVRKIVGGTATGTGPQEAGEVTARLEISFASRGPLCYTAHIGRGACTPCAFNFAAPHAK